MQKIRYFSIQSVIILYLIYIPNQLSAEMNKDRLLLNQKDTFYLALNSTPGRQNVMGSLDTLQHQQTDMINMLKGKASKAGARRIIRMIENLTENKADKADLKQALEILQQEMQIVSNKIQQEIKALSSSLSEDMEKISNALITITSQTSPHQRIQILAEIKNEQKNVKERIAEINNQLQRISVKTSQNRQSEMSRLVGTQTEINNDYAKIKQKLQDNKDIAKRNFLIALFFLILFIVSLVAWVYYYIYHQKRIKNEIYENTRIIVKEQYEQLLEQLYIEEHEDGRLTADDLKKMSERVKKKVIRQNWAKRKIEDRPAFI